MSLWKRPTSRRTPAPIRAASSRTNGRSLLAVETKSGQTIAGDFFAGLESFRALVAESQPALHPKNLLVYGGAESQKRSVAEVVSWSDLDRCRWWD
jgi:hypothetical protein